MICLFVLLLAGSTPGGFHGKYDDRMPTLAFFASKDIPAMTEVRFEFLPPFYELSIARVQCRVR